MCHLTLFQISAEHQSYYLLLLLKSFPFNFLILLIKSIARLSKPIEFKYYHLLFSSFEVIFPLLMISICKPCKCSFVSITVKKVLPSSVRVIKLEMIMLLSGKSFSINFFRSSNLPGTTSGGSLTVLLIPTCNILSSGHSFNSNLI